MRCPDCSTPIAPHAKFCPKCGKPAETGPAPLPRAAGALPSTGPIPRIGKLFLAMLFVGFALIAAGVAMRMPIILFVGLGVVAIVALVGVIGHHVS